MKIKFSEDNYIYVCEIRLGPILETCAGPKLFSVFPDFINGYTLEKAFIKIIQIYYGNKKI